MSSIKSIMFVCLGNICRSPLAEVIARQKISELNLDIEVASSGTIGYHEGNTACKLSIDIAKKNNIDLTNHKAQQFKEKHFNKYDLFIALDQSNFNDLEGYGLNLKKLGDFGFNGEDVPDPYYVGKIELVFDMIEKSITNLLNEIR